jgi:hypothetical protein
MLPSQGGKPEDIFVMTIQPIPDESTNISFLNGGGEMGERIRNKDWASTPLGPIEQWPQSLKTIVRIMLTTPSN